MSELLELANQFRSLDDEALHALMVRRSLSVASKDFLDLAESALAPKSIQFAVATLTASQIEALKAVLAKTASQAVATKFALETGLAIIKNESVALATAVEPIAVDLFALAAKTTQPQVHLVAAENLTPLAAVAAFETQQALTELILDAEQRGIRVVSRNAIGLPDIKRLALHLRKSPDYAKHCYRIAQRLGLIRLSEARWWLTDLAEGWLAENQAQRWLRLANNWVETLGKRAALELLETLESEPSIALNAALAKVFPLAQVALETHLAELVTQAEWLGLAVSQSPTDALTLLLSGKPQEAMNELEKFLPEPKEFLLAQGDQSLIAPGPLPTATEVLLRSFADVEQVSLASTYRLSALSVTHGLEMGLTEAEIRACLTKLTQKPLPQPIDYLLADTAKKFGRITVAGGQGSERSVVRSTDSLLLTEIHTDHRLKPYAFAPVSASALASRFEPEVIY